MASDEDSFGVAAALRAARALVDGGQAAEAERGLAQIIAAGSPVAAAYRELATLALRRGERARGVELLRRRVAIEPGDWASFVDLGVALRSLGRFDEAVAAYDFALAIKTDAPLIWGNRGNALLEWGRVDDALASFDRGLALAPESLEFHLGRVRALHSKSEFEQALEALKRAEALKPRNGEILAMRANALLGLKRPQEALEACDAALAITPDLAAAHGARARALVELHYASETPPGMEEIEAAFRRARTLDPEASEHAYAHGLMLLREGRFAEGFAAYERRWGMPQFRSNSFGQVRPELMRRLALNRRPEELDGRKVLLAAEQGVGDDILFASMIPDVLARAASVSLICQRRLHRLFAGSFPGLELIPPIAEGGVVPDCDLVIAMGSLGQMFRKRSEDFPGKPYLRPSQRSRDEWADWLGPQERLRVGISWRGGLKLTDGDIRSMTLGALRPLLVREDCEFVNLQYGEVAADLAEANADLPRPIRTPPAERMSDFDDLAGLIASLDLVVSVQTAVVHLSGAIGAPCLAMIPRRPAWRYGARGETMPWYGSVRLVRQGRDGEWGPVVARVTDEAARRAAD